MTSFRDPLPSCAYFHADHESTLNFIFPKKVLSRPCDDSKWNVWKNELVVERIMEKDFHTLKVGSVYSDIRNVNFVYIK